MSRQPFLPIFRVTYNRSCLTPAHSPSAHSPMTYRADPMAIHLRHVVFHRGSQAMLMGLVLLLAVACNSSPPITVTPAKGPVVIPWCHGSGHDTFIGGRGTRMELRLSLMWHLCRRVRQRQPPRQSVHLTGSRCLPCRKCRPPVRRRPIWDLEMRLPTHGGCRRHCCRRQTNDLRLSTPMPFSPGATGRLPMC